MMIERVALLIESWDGLPVSPIHSAKKDMEDWYSFLTSSLGGAWSEHEIKPLHSPIKKSCLSKISLFAQKCDYLFIAYSGHGGRNSKGDYINIHDGEILYLREILNAISNKCSATIILDACRSIRQLQEQVEFITNDYEEDYNLYAAQIIWNKAFIRLKKNIVIIQSCSAGQSANSGAYISNNGFFTEALIESAKEWSKHVGNGAVLNTYQAFYIATNYMNRKYGGLINSQDPQYTPSINITFPFAVNARITTSLFYPRML